MLHLRSCYAASFKLFDDFAIDHQIIAEGNLFSSKNLIFLKFLFSRFPKILIKISKNIIFIKKSQI